MTRNVKQKMGQSLFGVCVLLLMLGLTTYALVMSFVEVKNHEFLTGTVDIELNDGQPVFTSQDALLQPNAQIEKEFMIENKGTADVYYRLYIDNMEGLLKDALYFKVYEGTNLLFEGDSDDLSRKTACVSQRPLMVGESRQLKALVYMKKESGNQKQNQQMTFNFHADAVQVKNNPNGEFQ